MSMQNVMRAIISRWDDQSLGSSFTGGVWLERAPEDTSYPYVILRSIGSAPTAWTTCAEIRRYTVSMAIFYKEVASTDAPDAVAGLMNTLHSSFDFAPLTITGATCLEIRPVAEFGPDFADEAIWMGTIDYAIRVQESVTYSPS